MKNALTSAALRIAGVSAMTAAVSSCHGDDITFATQPLTCSISAPTQANATGNPMLSAADTRAVVTDLATRVVPSFAASASRDELAARLTHLAEAVGSSSLLAQCLGVESARRALAAFPSTPETAADRDVVVVNLDLVAESIRRGAQ